MSIILFEDDRVPEMYPITLTRPAFGVSCAGFTLLDVVRLTGNPVSCVVRDYLRKTLSLEIPEDSPGKPSMPGKKAAREPILFVNASSPVFQ